MRMSFGQVEVQNEIRETRYERITDVWKVQEKKKKKAQESCPEA